MMWIKFNQASQHIFSTKIENINLEVQNAITDIEDFYTYLHNNYDFTQFTWYLILTLN